MGINGQKEEELLIGGLCPMKLSVKHSKDLSS